MSAMVETKTSQNIPAILRSCHRPLAHQQPREVPPIYELPASPQQSPPPVSKFSPHHSRPIGRPPSRAESAEDVAVVAQDTHTSDATVSPTSRAYGDGKDIAKRNVEQLPAEELTSPTAEVPLDSQAVVAHSPQEPPVEQEFSHTQTVTGQAEHHAPAVQAPADEQLPIDRLPERPKSLQAKEPLPLATPDHIPPPPPSAPAPQRPPIPTLIIPERDPVKPPPALVIRPVRTSSLPDGASSVLSSPPRPGHARSVSIPTLEPPRSPSMPENKPVRPYSVSPSTEFKPYRAPPFSENRPRASTNSTSTTEFKPYRTPPFPENRPRASSNSTSTTDFKPYRTPPFPENRPRASSSVSSQGGVHPYRTSTAYSQLPVTANQHAIPHDGRPRDDVPYEETGVSPQSASPGGPAGFQRLSTSGRRTTMYFDAARAKRQSIMTYDSRMEKGQMPKDKGCWSAFTACFRRR